MHPGNHRWKDNLLFLLVVTWLGVAGHAAAFELPPLGHRLTPLPEAPVAPDFRLLDMDEQPHALSDYRGKVVMVNFWATWCPPCRREMPSMERLYRQYRDRGFVVLAVNQWEDPDHVFAFTGQLSESPSFPILFDPGSEASGAFAVKGLPSTYLVDKQGRIRYRAVGGREFDHPEVRKIIEALLREPPVTHRTGG